MLEHFQVAGDGECWVVAAPMERGKENAELHATLGHDRSAPGYTAIVVPGGADGKGMNALSLFGLVAVSGMLVTYANEHRGRTWVLAFAVSCMAGSAYGFLQGAWPFGLVEAVWSGVAIQRWRALG